MMERMVPEDNAESVNKFLFESKFVDNTIELINSKILSLEFRINKIVCEQDGSVHYVFLSTFMDNFSSKLDVSKFVFKQLVRYIIEHDGCVSFSNALKFHNQMSYDLMKSYFTNHYFIGDSSDNIYLSPLAISELEGYLSEHFNERRCMTCMNIVSHGVKCQSCGQYGHGLCLKKYFTTVKNQKCPKCSKDIDFSWEPITIVQKF